MAARFPKRNPDGSFCIEVQLRLGPQPRENLTEAVPAWFERWLPLNSRSQWFDEEMLYENEFSGPPFGYVQTPTHLHFRLNGKPGAKRWRDFLALELVKGLQRDFAEIEQVEAVHDCPDPAST